MYKLFFFIALFFCEITADAQSATILKANRRMKFEVLYTDSLQKIKIRDTVLLEMTNIPWRFDSLRQRTVVWHRHSTKITAGMKSKIYTLGSTLIDSTSVMETDREYHLNLPRSDYFGILSIAPTARFIKGTRVDDVYNTGQQLGPGWGIYENLELRNDYMATQRGAMQVNKKTYLYLQIDAVATCKFGKNSVSYFWNDDLGFIAADYRFYNGVKISMKLIAVE